MNTGKVYCYLIAIVGRPNVGKSTLFNSLLGRKISITSCKARTTRHRIFGVHTENNHQVIYIDNPGLHIRKKNDIDRLTNRTVNISIEDASLVIFVVESIRWTQEDEIVLKKIRAEKVPSILTVNKVDNIQKKTKLLPHLQFLSSQMHFLEIIPVSAETGMNLLLLKEKIHRYLTESNSLSIKERINNLSPSKIFIASEIIREKLLRFLGEELPYSISIKIEYFIVNERGYNIKGLIFVKHLGQKKIVIGSQGNKIKTIGIEARKDMQKFFEASVHLNLWVKIKSNLITNEHNANEYDIV